MNEDRERHLEFSNHYYQLRERVFLLRDAGESDYMLERAFPIPERVVRCIWYDQRFDGGALRTVDGRRVEVVSQGEWNNSAGPDFLDSLVRFDDGELLRGGVEIHVSASEWKRHGHHKQAGYENVILHVSMWNDMGDTPVDTSACTRVPQLELFPFLREDLWDVILNMDLENYPFSSMSRVGECHTALAENAAALLHLVRCAGQERFQQKARRLYARMETASPAEALYTAMMEGMGYRPNKKAFHKLARLTPWSVVSEVSAGAPPAEREEILQSLFFHRSGLFRKMNFNLWDIESREYFKRLNSHWERWAPRLPEGPAMDPGEWKTSGVRPANFPMRRMAAAASLLASQPGGALTGLLDELGGRLENAPTQKALKTALREFDALLTRQGGGYWARHMLPGGPAKEKTPALIGASLARTLVVNVFLPMLLCAARKADNEKLIDAAMRAFETCPALESHRITRLMAYRVWGDHEAGVPLKREIYQQGLLQLFFDFCDGNIRDCAACGFPEMVRLHKAGTLNADTAP